MKVRSLYLINLESLIKEVQSSVLDFMVETGIDVMNDLSNLFISRMFIKMSDYYKTHHDCFVIFYLENDIKLQLLECDGFINYKRFFRIMEKEVKFPVIMANLPYEWFANMMKKDCPEYDEVIANHRSFAELYPKLKCVIERLKFYRCGEKIVNDIHQRCQMLMSL